MKKKKKTKKTLTMAFKETLNDYNTRTRELWRTNALDKATPLTYLFKGSKGQGPHTNTPVQTETPHPKERERTVQ